MSESSTTLHENSSDLEAKTLERHRAIVSLIEELEAVDWYDQRIDATSDDDLAAILAHNRDEEKEHAAMTLEWLRRNDAALDAYLRAFLFTQDAITGHEQTDSPDENAIDARDDSLGIGSLRMIEAK